MSTATLGVASGQGCRWRARAAAAAACASALAAQAAPPAEQPRRMLHASASAVAELPSALRRLGAGW